LVVGWLLHLAEGWMNRKLIWWIFLLLAVYIIYIFIGGHISTACLQRGNTFMMDAEMMMMMMNSGEVREPWSHIPLLVVH